MTSSKWGKKFLGVEKGEAFFSKGGQNSSCSSEALSWGTRIFSRGFKRVTRIDSRSSQVDGPHFPVKNHGSLLYKTQKTL